MAMIATDFKGLLSIKIKPRDDTVWDQYSRIFMMKVLLISSVVCSISWYGDKFNCNVPESMVTFEDFPKFVGATCWIQGVYIYRELRLRNDDAAYYGITRDMDLDGKLSNNELCKTYDRLTNEKNENCIPLQKTFYQQYQYMPFLLAALALLYYVPYMFHKVANHDIIKLQEKIKEEKPDPEAIFKSFFKNRTGRPKNASRPTFIHVLIIFVKIFYIVVNILSFIGLNNILNGTFASFGSKWWDWAQQNNTMRYDYMSSREMPKPANEILPPFGYCELYSSAKDIKESHVNSHKVICELSQHVLYQYVFVLLWILLIIGILISIIGLIIYVVTIIAAFLGLRKFGKQPESRRIFERLTHREIDYLEFLQRESITIYGEILTLLTDEGAEFNSGVPLHDTMNISDNSPLMHGKYGDDIPLKRLSKPGYEL